MKAVRNLNTRLLIGCGKAKLQPRLSCGRDINEPTAAADMYVGSLFKMRRRYAEATGKHWQILSAKYGLLDPDQLVYPYDLRLSQLPEVDQAAWALSVAHALIDEMPDEIVLRQVTIELHAGAEYTERLADVLLATGFNVSQPVKGLGQGELMGFYKAALDSPLLIAAGHH